MDTIEKFYKPAPIAVGDYVYASETGQVEPMKAWAVGWVKHIYQQHEADGGAQVGFIIGDRHGNKTSDFIYPFARRISYESGHRIAATLRPRHTIGDQIRTYLREEAQKRRDQQKAATK